MTITLLLTVTPNCKGCNVKLTTLGGRLVANVTRRTEATALRVATKQAADVLRGFEILVREGK